MKITRQYCVHSSEPQRRIDCSGGATNEHGRGGRPGSLASLKYGYSLFTVILLGKNLSQSACIFDIIVEIVRRFSLFQWPITG
jgi:hypothetical protein